MESPDDSLWSRGGQRGRTIDSLASVSLYPEEFLDGLPVLVVESSFVRPELGDDPAGRMHALVALG